MTDTTDMTDIPDTTERFIRIQVDVPCKRADRTEPVIVDEAKRLLDTGEYDTWLVDENGEELNH